MDFPVQARTRFLLIRYYPNQHSDVALSLHHALLHLKEYLSDYCQSYPNKFNIINSGRFFYFIDDHIIFEIVFDKQTVLNFFQTALL